MEAPEKFYVTYIAATPEQVWSAFTEKETCQRFFFGRWMESRWTEGSQWCLMKDDGVDSAGEVLECTPPTRLTVTWRGEETEELRSLPHIVVTIEVEGRGDVTKLTVWETHDESASEEYKEGGRSTWPLVLSGLKTLLETGMPLPPPQKRTGPSA